MHTLRSKPAFVALTAAFLAFLLAPQAPLGRMVWPATVELNPAPTSPQLGLFMVLGLITAIAFGLGITFLLYGRAATLRAVGPGRPRLAAAAHLAVFWVLANWWVHDGLHMVAGMHAGRLLAIEYAFHVTLMGAGAVLAFAVITAADQRPSVAAR
jgi:hypothetical protein